MKKYWNLDDKGKYSSSQKITVYFIVLMIIFFLVLLLFAKNTVTNMLFTSIVDGITNKNILLSNQKIDGVFKDVEESVKNLFLYIYLFCFLMISITWWFIHKIYAVRISNISKSLSKLKYHKIKKEEGAQNIFKDEIFIVQYKINELVEEINAYYNELQNVSKSDLLTGVLNRDGLKKRIDTIYKEEIELKDREYSFLFLNINNFRAINESYGHQIGDMILQGFAKRIQALVGENDLVARVSGDEFVIFFTKKIDKLELEELEKKLLESTSKIYEIQEYILKINASIGFATYKNGVLGLDEAFDNAFLAMKHGKRCKKEGIILYEEFMKNRINALDILNAIKSKEIYMVYQPQIQSNTEKIISVEALVRWESKKFGFIPPNEFVRIAEDTGVIYELGRFIIEEVFTQMKNWKQKELHVSKASINLSPTQLLDKNLCKFIFELFDKYDIDKKEISFEITEEIPIREQFQAISNLKCLNESGISIYVDDFGKGYSALSYLYELPISGVKIDKFFVDKIEENDGIIKMIFALAKSMNLDVIVEGVETEKQKSILTGISDCTIQGYYYSKPLKQEDLIAKYF